MATDDQLIKVLRVDLVRAFNPDSREHRHTLQLLIALECFNMADEAFLSAVETLGGGTRKYICFLLKAGYLAEAYRAFICLDSRGWFDRYSPRDPDKLEEFNKALLRLRALSPEEPKPVEPCRCCGKVHNDSPKMERRPPAFLLRLRDKGAFHWDSPALRDAYRKILAGGTQPPVFRFINRRTRDVESPLAASLLSLLIEETEDIRADVQLALEVSHLFRLVIPTAVGIYLHSVGAELRVEENPVPGDS